MATDLRQIRNFIAVAETLNFRAAAERLHMAQPPLSVSIRKLEEQLGCALFTRDRRGTQLTPAGSAALTAARRALFDISLFESAAHDAAAGLAGSLSIGYVASTTYAVLPALLPTFRERFPAIQLRLVERSTEGVLEGVEQGTFDLGLMRTPLAGPTRATVSTFLRESLVAALPDVSPWRRRTRIALPELAEQPFVFYSSPYAQALTMHMCEQAGFVPRVSQQAGGVPTVVSLVKCGLGVALVPQVAREWPLPGVRFVDLSDTKPGMQMGIGIAWMKDREVPAGERFRALVGESFGAGNARPRRFGA